LAALAGAPLEEIALAIASEFKPVNVARARAQLDLLATSIDPDTVGDPQRRAEELINALGDRAGFAVDSGDHPHVLMLDSVLAQRSGHPLALAIVYAAVAARAGFKLYPVGDQRAVLLGDPEPQPPLAVDPAPGGRTPPAEMRWLCPHVVALRLLDAIGIGYMNRGHLAGAIRAAELRLLLPLHPRLREHHLLALRKLRARLN
jgi:hypothetical protein